MYGSSADLRTVTSGGKGSIVPIRPPLSQRSLLSVIGSESMTSFEPEQAAIFNRNGWLIFSEICNYVFWSPTCSNTKPTQPAPAKYSICFEWRKCYSHRLSRSRRSKN